MKDTVNVRVWRTSWKRLKIRAIKEGKSTPEMFDELTKSTKEPDVTFQELTDFYTKLLEIKKNP